MPCARQQTRPIVELPRCTGLHPNRPSTLTLILLNLFFIKTVFSAGFSLLSHLDYCFYSLMFFPALLSTANKDSFIHCFAEAT